MKAILITMKQNPEYKGSEPSVVPGWEVPDTHGLFGVDLRVEGDGIDPNHWAITHLPSGLRANSGYFLTSSRDRAIKSAQAFFIEMAKLEPETSSARMITSDATEFMRPYRAQTKKQGEEFWKRILERIKEPLPGGLFE